MKSAYQWLIEECVKGKRKEWDDPKVGRFWYDHPIEQIKDHSGETYLHPDDARWLRDRL